MSTLLWILCSYTHAGYRLSWHSSAEGEKGNQRHRNRAGRTRYRLWRASAFRGVY